MSQFQCSYNNLAQILNYYEDVISLKPLLDSVYKTVRINAAEVIHPLLLAFEVNVPEETRKDLRTQIETLKKKCLEILSTD